MTDRVCRENAPFLGTFVDGELEGQEQLELEAHIGECEGCREYALLESATRSSIKSAVKVSVESDMRVRLVAAMNAEAGRATSRNDALKKGAAWRTIVPLASAAAFALAWGAMSKGPLARTTNGGSVRAGFGDDLLAELVAEHSRPLPPERTSADDVSKLGQYVGVPIHPAAFQNRASARFVGGRVLPMHQERAAMLQYEIQNNGETRRVSIIVFDPRRIQVNDAALRARPMGTSEVRVGRSNGYSVAVMQQAGVGYALASDMDESRTAELAMQTSD